MDTKDNHYKCVIIDRLLEKEYNNEEPPRRMWNVYRNTFHIPFQTEKYKQWWSAGPTPKEILYTNTEVDYDSNDSMTREMNSISSFKKAQETEIAFKEWIAKYLLELESNNKDVPYSAFEIYRNKFEIPFKTDKFNSWWTALDTNRSTWFIPDNSEDESD